MDAAPTFTYDAYGNRITKTVNGMITTYTYADVTERAPIFLCYACWNICNIATLTAGLLLIFLAFSANAFFRGGFGRLWKKSGAAGDTLDSFFARGSNGVPRNKNEKIDVADDLSESGTGRWKK